LTAARRIWVNRLPIDFNDRQLGTHGLTIGLMPLANLHDEYEQEFVKPARLLLFDPVITGVQIMLKFRNDLARSVRFARS
jgi:hypothetical protein